MPGPDDGFILSMLRRLMQQEDAPPAREPRPMATPQDVTAKAPPAYSTGSKPFTLEAVRSSVPGMVLEEAVLPLGVAGGIADLARATKEGRPGAGALALAAILPGVPASAKHFFPPTLAKRMKAGLRTDDVTTWIDPAEFGELATDFGPAGPNMDKLRNVRQIIERGGGPGNELLDVPFLRITRDSRNVPYVWGHEGRHRMLALAEKGYDEAPIRLQGIDVVPPWSVSSPRSFAEFPERVLPQAIREPGAYQRPARAYPIEPDDLAKLEPKNRDVLASLRRPSPDELVPEPLVGIHAVQVMALERDLKRAGAAAFDTKLPEKMRQSALREARSIQDKLYKIRNTPRPSLAEYDGGSFLRAMDDEPTGIRRLMNDLARGQMSR